MIIWVDNEKQWKEISKWHSRRDFADEWDKEAKVHIYWMKKDSQLRFGKYSEQDKINNI